MYYVIKKQPDNQSETFIWFRSPKFIVSKESENVIFEFPTQEKLIRKWVNKSEIILLTDDKEYFVKVLNQLKDVQDRQQKLVDEAHKHLQMTLERFTETMQQKFGEYDALRNANDIPLVSKEI